MTYSSRGRHTSATHLQHCIKAKTMTAILAVFIFLLVPRLWGESRKEYIHADGRVVAVETEAAGCGQSFTISQAAGCASSLFTPTGANMPSTKGQNH